MASDSPVDSVEVVEEGSEDEVVSKTGASAGGDDSVVSSNADWLGSSIVWLFCRSDGAAYCIGYGNAETGTL